MSLVDEPLGRVESARSADGKPDGVIFAVPELEQATDAEKQAFLRKLIETPEQVIPKGQRGPTFTRPEAPAASLPVERPAPAETPSDLFDADAALYDAASYRTEPYTMPNGKRLWVHPFSFEERLEVSKETLGDLKAGGYLRAPETQEAAERLELERRAAGLAIAQLYQTLRCARQGPEPGAPRVFRDEHAAALRRNPGWSSAVEAIATLSDQLSEGKTEAEHLREMLTDFFGRLQSALETCCLRLKAASGEGERPPEPVSEVADFLEDFAVSVSALKQPGRPFGNRELQALALVLGLPE
jgi:hypothetical protein